jgi:LmbE family N-acetylglucosaminyl deacetylase
MKPVTLVVVAHPDDETLHCGALIARAAQSGERVVILALTRGAAGRTLGVCPPDALAAVRERELRAAARVLGAEHVEVCDLPDGALTSSRAAAVSHIREALVRWSPARVIAFPPNGFNGHPDHRAAHRVTLEAVRRQKVAPALWLMTSATPFSEPARAGFLPPAEVERTRLPVTVTLPVEGFLAVKLRAMGQYETQARSVTKVLRCYPEKLVTEAFHIRRLW